MSLIVTDRPIGHKSNALTPAEDYPIVQAFGSLSPAGGWVGSCTSREGNIYCAPYSSAHVLKIIPSTRAYSLIGFVGNSGNKYRGLTRAPNGNMYAAPSSATDILKIDTSDNVTTFGSVAAGNFKYRGFVLANNGALYAVPGTATTILKVDPATDTVTTFGSFSVNSCGGGALAPNGKIYCTPASGGSILVIDPDTDTVSTFGSLPLGDKYEGAVLNYNGKIYGMPSNSFTAVIGIIEIDPDNDSYQIVIDSQYDSWGGAIAPNGKIYCTPDVNDQSVLEIDLKKLSTRLIGITGPIQIPTWAGKPSLSHEGKLFAAPFANRILEISRIGQVTPEMYTMPENISGLSRSVYNIHNNHV